MITLFEKYIRIKDRIEFKKVEQYISHIDPEFWNMVELVNWDSVIDHYKNNSIINQDEEIIEDQIKFKLFKKYDFEQIKQFNTEFQLIYQILYAYFTDYFENLDPENFDEYSDDFTDVIKSTIGRGREAITKCINRPNLIIKIGENNDYSEGFEHLLDVTEEEFWEIKCKDPFFRDTRKFNL